MGGEGFRFSWPVVAPDGPVPGIHVLNTQLQLLLADAWVAYLDAVNGDRRDRTLALWPTVREVLVRFERECFPGDPLTCGVRPTGRGRRSFTLAEELRHGDDGPVVATGHVVIVTVDRVTGRPVEVPGDFWARVEDYERGEAAPT